MALDYEPTTKWPYLYEDFIVGTVSFSKGNKTEQMKLNIHLQNCTLHYLDGDHILQADPRNIVKVQMENDTFIYMNGELVRLISMSDNGLALVKLVRADLDELNKNSSGAYGMSTTSSSVSQILSIELIGLSNLLYTRMKCERNEGRELPLIEQYYIIIGERSIKTTKKDIEKFLDDDEKARFKSYLKQNKINWKDEASLVKLLDFFHL